MKDNLFYQPSALAVNDILFYQPCASTVCNNLVCQPCSLAAAATAVVIAVVVVVVEAVEEEERKRGGVEDEDTGDDNDDDDDDEEEEEEKKKKKKKQKQQQQQQKKKKKKKKINKRARDQARPCRLTPDGRLSLYSSRDRPSSGPHVWHKTQNLMDLSHGRKTGWREGIFHKGTPVAYVRMLTIKSPLPNSDGPTWNILSVNSPSGPTNHSKLTDKVTVVIRQGQAKRVWGRKIYFYLFISF